MRPQASVESVGAALAEDQERCTGLAAELAAAHMEGCRTTAALQAEITHRATLEGQVGSTPRKWRKEVHGITTLPWLRTHSWNSNYLPYIQFGNLILEVLF